MGTSEVQSFESSRVLQEDPASLSIFEVTVKGPDRRTLSEVLENELLAPEPARSDVVWRIFLLFYS